MKITRIFHENKKESIESAVECLRDGGLVAFPTETVYGLGADGLSPSAVSKIFEAKGRPQDNPLILHVASIEDFSLFAEDIPPYVIEIASLYCPGPITFVLKKKSNVPDIVTAGLDTVCLRIPNHRVALHIIESLGHPIAAPSANRSGRPSPTLASHVREDLDGKVDIIIDGGSTDIGIESTVLDCTGEIPLILREGAINRAMIEDVLGISLPETMHASKKSPGTRYRHYAPIFPIEISQSVDRSEIFDQVKNNPNVAFIFYDEADPMIEGERIYHFHDQGELSRSLFSLFRKLEKHGIQKLFIERIMGGPLQFALMNRIEKAAGL